MNNVVTLRDTKITIEIEAVRMRGDIPDSSDSKDKVFPYMITTRLKVGDRQLGLVSNLSLHVGTKLVPEENLGMPLLEVDLLGGAKPLGEECVVPLGFELTPELKEALEAAAGALRQFPFVKVNVPLKPVV